MDVVNQGKEGYIPVQTQKDTLFHILHDYKANNNTKIIVIENRLEKKTVNGILRRTFIMEKEENEKGFKPYDTSNPDLKIGDENSLREVLGGIIKAEKALNRMIITKGHGSIFGMFLTEESQAYRGIDTSALVKDVNDLISIESVGLFKEKTVVDLGYYRYQNNNVFIKPDIVRQYLSSFDVLTNKELAFALEGGLDDDEMIDILVMDNCLMQNVCTQDDMKDVVRYLVAAQSGISYPGFNYQEILDNFLSGPPVSADEIGDKIINTLKTNKKFIKFPALLAELNGTWSIHVKELTNFHLFEEKFTQLINDLLAHPASEVAINYLKDALDGCFHYNKYCLNYNATVDIKVVLYYFGKFIKDVEACSSLYLPVQDCLASLNLISGVPMVGPDLYDSFYKFYDKMMPEPISGIGILWPVNNSEIDETRLTFLKDPNLQPAFFVNTGFLQLLTKMNVLS